jgi:transcriptional regulator with XRE-family HTH domain
MPRIIKTAIPNILVGFNIKKLRMKHGLTQQDLGKIMGITFQQIQKYENGRNRISADKMFSLSQIFGCKMEDFFHSVNLQEKAIPCFGEDGKMVSVNLSE